MGWDDAGVPTERTAVYSELLMSPPWTLCEIPLLLCCVDVTVVSHFELLTLSSGKSGICCCRHHCHRRTGKVGGHSAGPLQGTVAEGPWVGCMGCMGCSLVRPLTRCSGTLGKLRQSECQWPAMTALPPSRPMCVPCPLSASPHGWPLTGCVGQVAPPFPPNLQPPHHMQPECQASAPGRLVQWC